MCGDAGLETERLILGPWEAADWSGFRPIATDPEVMRYINGGIPWEDDAIHRFVERQVARYEEHGYCRWKLVEKTSGELAGFCGLGLWRDCPDLEIGWWLARRFWGRGLATEAARAALDDIFARVNPGRVMSIAQRANGASIRVMEKIGLQRVREFESDGLELVQYGIERERYVTRKAGCQPAAG
jgi:RimJ/RimL family protein N-acetyltransferase